jgi:glycosyltransferase involved in cell wall biosynthesis
VIYAALARPDILHIHAIGPALVTPLARLLGLRVVVTHHGADYEREKWGAFARWVLRLGEFLGMKCANERIAVSRVIADQVRSKYARECKVIPNGVPVATRNVKAEYVAGLGLEPGRYFLQVSRIVPEKRQLDLINAYAKADAPGWKLVLVGGTDTSEYVREVQAAAGRHGVLMTGYKGGEPLTQLYSHAGAFVLPSSHEGLPIVLLEALSFGCRVLASDIPANLEVGLARSSYFPVGDVDSLARDLSDLARLADGIEEREARTRFVASRYDWDAIAKTTLGVYKGVCQTWSTPGPRPCS